MRSMPARANTGTSHHTAAIMATLRSTGVAAGTAKRFQVLRTPADSETSEMKPMYGNMTRVMTTASSKRSRPEAMSHTTTGAATTPTMHVTTRTENSTVATASTSCWVASSPSAARVRASVGTKACENAPSANSRRSRLGMQKATLKASNIAPAPNTEATTTSRSRPVTRDASVQTAVDACDKAKAAEPFKTAPPIIDSVADKTLFHVNKAARHKSRLAAKVKALATAA